MLLPATIHLVSLFLKIIFIFKIFHPGPVTDACQRADAQMPSTKNSVRQMVSVGDPISQKNETSGFTWDRIPSKTKWIPCGYH